MKLLTLRLQKLSETGGWRRFYIAGTGMLAIASVIWAWHVQLEDMDGWEFLEFALALWAMGAVTLAILTAVLSLLDSSCVWVGRGFGLAPATTRIGLCAVLAGLTFAATAAIYLRYETVMPEGGARRTGDLCVVLDRWTGEAKPCTEEAVTRRHRKRSEPLRVEESQPGELLWRQFLALAKEVMEIEKWLPGMLGGNIVISR